MSSGDSPSSKHDRKHASGLVGAVLLVLVAASLGFPAVTLVTASVLALALLIGAPLRTIARRRGVEQAAPASDEAPDLETALRPDRIVAERREVARPQPSKGAASH